MQGVILLQACQAFENFLVPQPIDSTLARLGQHSRAVALTQSSKSSKPSEHASANARNITSNKIAPMPPGPQALFTMAGHETLWLFLSGVRVASKAHSIPAFVCSEAKLAKHPIAATALRKWSRHRQSRNLSLDWPHPLQQGMQFGMRKGS